MIQVNGLNHIVLHAHLGVDLLGTSGPRIAMSRR
jgi:hypothetical protein